MKYKEMKYKSQKGAQALRREVFAFPVKQYEVEFEFQFPQNLRFECKRCGNCCRHELPVELLSSDLSRIQEVKSLPRDFFIEGERLGPNVPGRQKSLATVPRSKDGEEQCIFLRGANHCDIHENRPQRCRTFPFYLDATDFRKWVEARLYGKQTDVRVRVHLYGSTTKKKFCRGITKGDMKRSVLESHAKQLFEQAYQTLLLQSIIRDPAARKIGEVLEKIRPDSGVRFI